MNDKTFPVVECYGVVCQGEGIMAGQQTYFLRLGGCDYRCGQDSEGNFTGKFVCDSLYAVLPEQVKANATKMTAKEIASKLEEMDTDKGVKHVTISGGNPAMHDLDEVISELGVFWDVATETQGTVFKPWIRKCALVTMSPKPPSSGNVTTVDVLKNFLDKLTIQGEMLAPELCFKIVVFDEVDYEYAREMYASFRGYGGTFYLQPGTTLMETRDAEIGGHFSAIDEYRNTILTRTEAVINLVVKDPAMTGVRVLPQIHSLIFGNIKGV